MIRKTFLRRFSLTTMSAGLIIVLLFSSCSSKKNTSMTRAYHSINTRYNIHFNANEAYKEALKTKYENEKDNLSKMISIFPYDPDKEEKQNEGGPFDITIDKSTKAIKLHSIQTKPERDPNKKRDEKYKEWLKQKEFNPFLKNSWLLMAKAEYQNEDYLRAISTFSYITHLYNNDIDVLTEARLWIALSYTQMGWMYEADNIFYKLQAAGGLPDSQKDAFSKIYANYLVRNEQYREAIPYLVDAIKHESNFTQKTRMRYLLGQIYAKLDEKENAYAAFDKVQGMRTPLEISLYSKIRQSELYNPDSPSERKKIISSLDKMGKNSKNKEYFDVIYYALGNIYLNENDTVNAIKNYVTGVEKSTRNGFDKGITQLRLGDLYFEQRNFVAAQPSYSEAINLISKKDDRYPRAALRAEVLDELVVHVQAIHLQDSLQHLASLPEDERLKAIQKHIEEVKKEEERLAKEARIAEIEAERESSRTPSPTMPSGPSFPGDKSSSFYFYNPQTVEQGKIAFQRVWGNRKLEDNWRRTNKRTTTFETFETQDTTPQLDSLGNVIPPQEKQDIVDDKYNPEYYLQQLPLTPEAIEASNAIIENALFNMGKIYKDRLEDPYLAIDAFETDIRRFPNTSNLEEIYYQLFLIYLQLGDKQMTELYRSKLLSEFAGNNYAVTLTDPNYEWNMRNITTIQDSLYDKTYDAYLNSKINVVRDNYKYIKEKYPLSDLMPKFMLLNALTYAQTNDEAIFKQELKDLTEKYPKSDVFAFAEGMLKNLASGRKLSPDGTPTKGMIWDLRFGTDDDSDPSNIEFTNKPDVEYTLLLIFNPKTVDPNQLIYDVASYNFSNYRRRVFDLSFSSAGSINFLQVKGLRSYNDLKDYMNKAFEPESLISQLDPSMIIVPISVDNLSALMKGKSLNEYFEFFKQNHAADMRRLISIWDKQIDQEIQKQEEEQKKLEEEAAQTLEEGEEVTPETETKSEEKPVEKTEPTKTEEEKAKEEKERLEQQLPERGKTEKPEEKTPVKTDQKTEVSAADAFSDDQVETIDNVINTATDIINNPVDGLKNIFNKNKNKPKLTKEEKAEQKKEKAEQRALERERKKAEKAEKDSINNIEKEAQRKIEEAEKQKENEEKQKIKDREDQVKAAEKAKEDARKQRQEELKQKERDRKEKLKQKEQERKDKLKQKEEERKQKEKERNEKLKQREQERKQKERNRR